MTEPEKSVVIPPEKVPDVASATVENPAVENLEGALDKAQDEANKKNAQDAAAQEIAQQQAAEATAEQQVAQLATDKPKTEEEALAAVQKAEQVVADLKSQQERAPQDRNASEGSAFNLEKIWSGLQQAILDFYNAFFGGAGLNIESASEVGENQWESTADDEEKTQTPESKALNKSANEKLKAVLAEHPDYLESAKQASTQYEPHIPISTIFAIIYKESRFNPTIKNKNSSARGLGQFIDKTWASFITENPEFNGKDQSDPIASIHATTWLAAKNAKALGIDVNSPDATQKIYEAHHSGVKGVAEIEKYRKGEGKLKIPKSYSEKFKDPKEYEAFVSNYSKGVQSTADQFQAVLA